jgi:PAS domain-containing protein
MSQNGETSPLAATIETFEDLYENAPCGYLSVQLDGQIFRVNATLASWIGYTPEQLVGKRSAPADDSLPHFVRNPLCAPTEHAGVF